MLQSTFYCIYLCEYLSDLEEWTPESGISKCMNILFTVHTQILLITSIMCTVTTPSHPPWRSSQDSLFFYLFIYFLRAAPTAYGNSQARGRIGATATGLHHGHSNSGSELHL